MHAILSGGVPEAASPTAGMSPSRACHPEAFERGQRLPKAEFEATVPEEDLSDAAFRTQTGRLTVRRVMPDDCNVGRPGDEAAVSMARPCAERLPGGDSPSGIGAEGVATNRAATIPAISLYETRQPADAF